jgi:cell division protein FtsL
MPPTSPVLQASPSGISLRHSRPSPQTDQYRARAPSPQGFRIGSLLMSLFLCLAGVGVYMWPRVQVVRLAYRMHTSDEQLRELSQERDQLRLELAALQDPHRIFRVATEQLGMSPPRHDQVVFVTRDVKRR